MYAIVCGTNRPNALSLKLCVYYQALLQKQGHQAPIIDLAQLPANFTQNALYAHAGKNEAFNALAAPLVSAQKVLFVVPEYNGSFPGVLKTFIDGLPYPNPLKGKKCALVGLSAGVQGGGLALSHLTDIFNYLGAHVLAQKPKLAKIEGHFDGHTISNALYQQLIDEQIEALLGF